MSDNRTNIGERGPTADEPSPARAEGAFPVVGYADRWSVAPDETVRFMVGTNADSHRAEIVRLLHGDDRPGAPGLKEESVATSVDGKYPGRAARYPTGSCVVVPDAPELRLASFTLSAWIFATTPGKRPQGLVTKWSSGDDIGFGLVINDRGELALQLGAGGRTPEVVASGRAIRANQWYMVAASYDATTGTVRLVQHPQSLWPGDASDVVLEQRVRPGGFDDGSGPMMLAAWAAGPDGSGGQAEGHYNGKIESPAIHATALDRGALESLAAGASPMDLGPAVAAWDLAADTSSDRIRDISDNGLHGTTVNMPTRGMTGHSFRGGDGSWVSAPNTHNAIHFHDDDLEDCGWEVAFEFCVPSSLASGVYAAKLTTDDSEFHVPFFVRPRDRRASASILLLAPTNSYLAYANFQEPFATEHGVLGLYHEHGDGSAVVYSSARRPIVNFRPGSNFPVLGEDGAPHQFNADLYLVDWLTAKEFAFDVATDEDLHGEGTDLLDQYRVVLTGTHPEYWSATMLDALEAYLEQGGRLMYLGGNGLIWNTTFAPGRPHVVEVRRGVGPIRYSRPGESHHSTTGELGGAWRIRGRPPNRLLGVGSIAQGFDHSAPYHRQGDSYDPRARWIFDGVGDDEPIGDFGLTMGGAAGFEVGCTDFDAGTPPHALTVASATEFSSTYEHQYPQHVAGTDIDHHDAIRGDMVYFETPNAGAVFSVGSIAYCGALSHHGYDNNISRITENVLSRFSQDGGLPVAVGTHPAPASDDHGERVD